MFAILVTIIILILVAIIFQRQQHKRKPRWRFNFKTASNYELLLNRPEWKAKVIEIKNRDGNKCTYCGSTLNLQVHHKYYSRYPNGQFVMPWDYPNSILITLCDKCHKRVHSTKQIKTYYRKYEHK